MQLYFNRQGNRKNFMNYKDMWESPYGKEQYLNIFENPEKLVIPEAYIVTATSGLSVRKRPSLKAKKVGSMPHKLRIAAYKESKSTETIDGITAPWLCIKAVANGEYLEGWAWGGYLEKFVYTEQTQE